MKVHSSKQDVSTQIQEAQGQATSSVSTNTVTETRYEHISLTSKEQILSSSPDLFEGISRFPGPPYHKQVDLNVKSKQTPCRLVPVHLKEAFKKEVDKMLKAGIIKPVQEATPQINSFVLVAGKDKLGNLKTLHMPWSN